MRQTSDALLDDGLVDITVIPDLPLSIIARKAFRLFTGSFTKVKELCVGRGAKVEVIPENVLPNVEVDGENVGQAPVRFEIMPSQINILGVK
jgi:diacylglycerol kinase family enzyme